jgi:hypothetical protein
VGIGVSFGPADLGAPVPARPVRVPHVVHLVAQCVLQEVPRLLLGQAVDQNPALIDVHDPQAGGFGFL